jgi:hypothetical protein
MERDKPRISSLIELDRRLYELVEAQQWSGVIGILTDLDFLSQKAKQAGPYAGWSTGYPISTFLESFLHQIPEEYKKSNQRLNQMDNNTRALSASLELHYVRGVGRLDPEASCKECGEASIVHGDVDLGAYDDWDNYFSMCTNCFWAWHVETYNQSMSRHNIGKFNYESNKYIGYT